MGTPCGYLALKRAAPSLFSDSSEPSEFCVPVLPLERKLISAPRLLTSPERIASPAEPGGIWRRKSAVSEPCAGRDAGGGSDQVGTYGGDVADGRPAVAVADQVDLGLAAEGDDFLHLLQQLLAADFRGVQLADFGDVDLGTVTAQGAGNAEPVVDPEDVVEAEHAVASTMGYLVWV